MPVIMKNNIAYVGSYDSQIKELTLDEYTALEASGKINPEALYFITDYNEAYDASKVIYDNTKNSIKSGTVQGAIDELNSSLGNVSFGIDGDGNYGYYGADGSLIPFFLGEVHYLQTFSVNKKSVTLVENSYTFTEDYKAVLVYMLANDVDNNGDNLMKCYSTKQTATKYTELLDVIENEWDYAKPIIVTDTSYPKINSSYTNDKDLNKDIYFATGTSSANCYACIAYKINVKQGEQVFTYDVPYRRDLLMIIGIK